MRVRSCGLDEVMTCLQFHWERCLLPFWFPTGRVLRHMPGQRVRSNVQDRHKTLLVFAKCTLNVSPARQLCPACAHTHTQTHTLVLCAHTKRRWNSSRHKQQRQEEGRSACMQQQFFLTLFHSPSPAGFPLKTLDVAAALTAVGVRVMTSSGFPSVLCYSELSVLPLPSSTPSEPAAVAAAAALMFHHLLMLRCHRLHLASCSACLALSIGWEKQACVWRIVLCSNMCTSIIRWNVFAVLRCR